mgnify:CR=1 FL=1
MAEFNVAAGRLKGSYDAVLISTDLEPDDAICLAVLAPMLKGVPLLCVVGEGPNDKRTMMAELLATFGIDEGEVDQLERKWNTWSYEVEENKRE